MKNIFILAMFIFWGFVVAVISASYVIKQNNIAQSEIQKNYIESIQKNVQQVIGLLANPSTSPYSGIVGTSEVVPKTTTVTTVKPVIKPAPVVTTNSTPTPTPAPVPTPKPASSGITMTDVALHNTQSDCWIVISGKVYSVSSYIPMHPGGAKKIVRTCGKDATSPYNGQGHSSYADSLLGQYFVGILQ